MKKTVVTCLFCYLSWSAVIVLGDECLKNAALKKIPDDHLYFKLKHPIIIGHMGNIKRFQENSIEGIRSLITIKAGGVHLHVRLTKDNQLILFQDDNLYRMTGENYDVYKLPYSVISNMRLQKTIHYYSDPDERKKVRTFNYDTTVGIPLLRTAFDELRGKGLLVYIEMMPNNVPPKNPLDRYLSLKSAELLSKLIKDYEMEKEVLVVSRDAFKLNGMNYYNPAVPTGWMVHTEFYQPSKANAIKVEYDDFPPLYTKKCFDSMSEVGASFVKKLVTTGLVSKAVNSSFLEATSRIYEDSQDYISTTTSSKFKDVVSTNYGSHTSFGVMDVFSWNETETSNTDQSSLKENDRKYIERIVGYGASRIVTNDVNRVKEAVDAIIVPFSQGASLHSYLWTILLAILFSKMTISLIFV